MKTFRACVVGIGFIGAAHIETLRRLGNVEVVALSNTSNAQAKAEAYFVPKGYTDYREMLDTEKPDVVHICTPNASHYEIAMYAMQRNIAVVCEKPLTKTLEEARELAAYAREHKIVTGVNFNCRWYPQTLQVKAMIESGEVGDIRTIHGGYIQDWLFYDTDYSWRLEPEVSGDSRAFADIGSHWIDMVESATGLRVVELLADFETFHKIRRKPLKPIETFSGMALKPRGLRRKADQHRGLLHGALPLQQRRARHLCRSARCLPAARIRFSSPISGSKCSLLLGQRGQQRTLDWPSRNGYNQKVAAKDPSILSPLARAVRQLSRRTRRGLPRYV